MQLIYVIANDTAITDEVLLIGEAHSGLKPSCAHTNTTPFVSYPIIHLFLIAQQAADRKNIP